jgi:hypothetical protein
MENERAREMQGGTGRCREKSEDIKGNRHKER